MKKTLLLVEDDCRLAMVVTMLLEDTFCPITCTSLQQVVAFKGLKEAIKPDVILLDLNLPDSQEMATIDEVRKEFPVTPVVIFTGMAIRREDALQRDADGVLLKGDLTKEDFLEALSSAMTRREIMNQSKQENT